jgi:hypothetical protein
MIRFHNRILHKNNKGHIGANLLCMGFGAVMALSIQALAGPPQTPVPALHQMPSELKPYAIALGQRLQKPGKERITALGKISYPGDTPQQAEPVRITWQYPLKMRLDRGGNSLTLDRNNPEHPALEDAKTSKTVQTLLEDSTEGLFAMQKKGVSRRFMGSGFSLEGASASDPSIDIVVISYADVFQRREPILKSYWFNSRTKLLGVVTYTSPAGVLTHVVIDDWREVEGEMIPFRIERWENNKLAMRLHLDSATVSAGTEDSALGGD